jgi:hypothetical protein
MATIPNTITPGIGNWIWQNQYGDMSFSAQASSTQPDPYRFHADVGGSYVITVGGFIDSQFRVYNSSGTPVTQVINSGGFGTSETTSFTATADSWYYVEVAGVGTGTGLYTLSVNGPDLVRNTISLSSSTNAGSATGTVSPAGDIDYFAVVAPSGTTSLNLTVTPDAGLNTWVELYDNAGTRLQQIINGGNGSPDTASNIAVTAGATYWVGVSSASSTQTGGYTVNADFNPDTSSPFTVSGKFEYHDKDYNQNGLTGTFTDRPIRYATVEIWEDNGGPSNVRLGTTFTAADGTWSFAVPDNNDPSGRDIFVKVIADTAAGTVTNANATTYVYTGPTVNNWQGGTMWYDASPLDGSNQAVRPATDEYTAAFNILDDLVTGYQYLNNQGYNPGHVTAQYRVGTAGTNYNGTVHIEGISSDDDGFDDSAIIHEYGHFAADSLSFLNNVGGTHSWEYTYANYYANRPLLPAGTGGPLSLLQSQELAWNEGFASFFSSAVRNDPYYVDTYQGGSSYVNIENGTSNAFNASNFVGDDNEAAVAMVLWDIFDSANGSQDSVSAGIDEILNIIHNPTYFSASTGDTLYDLYRGWRGLGYSNLDGVREILEARGIAYWPFVTSVSDSPDPVTTSASLTLTANVLATVSTVASVSFYRESNGIAGLQIGSGGDVSVGTDTSASSGWSVSVNTSGLANGTYTYYALATDSAGDISATGANVHSTTNTVNGTVNHAPTITSNGGGDTASVSVAENSTTVTTVAASDQDGNALTYSLSGGNDQAKFQINSLTGALSFITALNFEAPGSAAGNNSYIVQVRVVDNGNPALADVQTITVNVTDVNEATNHAPTITSNGGGDTTSVSVAENSTTVTTVAASDQDGNALTYSLGGGNDQGKFQINSLTGALSFITAPNFEAPGSAAGNNSYVVQVRVVDNGNPALADVQTINVNVTDVNEGQPTTVTLQPGSEGQDLWITNTFNYNDDYGVDNAQLKVGGWGDVYDTLIKFDLSSIHASHATSAILQLYSLGDLGGTPTGMSIEELQQSWDESYGWFNYGGARGTPSADPANLSFQHLSTVGAPGGGWISIDITAAVNDWLSGVASNNGLLIRPLSTNNNFNDFVSSDATGANASFHPKLVIQTQSVVNHAVPTDYNGDTFSDILFRNNSTGDTGYTDIHNNVFHSLGGSPAAWSVVGSGDYNGDTFSDILFRDNSTGDTGFTDLHNNVFHSLGGSPASSSVVGSGDYNGDTFSDILFRNNSTGDTGYTDLHNNVFHSLGGSPAAWSVVGSGDYNGDSFSDILFRNNATGDTGYTDLHNNVFHSLGGSPVAYSVVGSGDYNGDSFSDILFRNNSTGDTGYTDLHNNVYHPLGGSPTTYSVVGSGDYNGDSFSDILFRNNSTGDTGYTDLHNNVFHSLGGSPAAYLVMA